MKYLRLENFILDFVIPISQNLQISLKSCSNIDEINLEIAKKKNATISITP